MIFTPKEWYDMAAAAERLSHPSLRMNPPSLGLDVILDHIVDIEDVCPGLHYRCHICGIPWGH